MPHVNYFCDIESADLLSHSLDGPLLLAQRTAIVLFDPQRHAAVVERVVAFTPNDDTVLAP